MEVQACLQPLITHDKGYVYLVPAITNLKIPIDAGLVNVADDCHVRHTAIRAWAWKTENVVFCEGDSRKNIIRWDHAMSNIEIE